jgi:hypothetical protein
VVQGTIAGGVGFGRTESVAGCIEGTMNKETIDRALLCDAWRALAEALDLLKRAGHRAAHVVVEVMDEVKEEAKG